MRVRCAWLMVAVSLGAPIHAAELAAGPVEDVSITLYRSPYRSSGSLQLAEAEGGFALIGETRTVSLPPGRSRIRFEGVADGLDASSVVLTGLLGEMLERNRDAQLLSPSALIDAALGEQVVLQRSDARTGRTSQEPATIRSDAEGGVVLETAQGIEALRCSGLPETLEFTRMSGLSPVPTLSVSARTASAVSARVTLSYLARGFDWAANYVAMLSADATHLQMGGWVTLADANGTRFSQARVQVVAGRVRHDNGTVEPIVLGTPIFARCWPRGSTSDPVTEQPMLLRQADRRSNVAVPASTMDMAVAGRAMTASLVQQEQLGDLKLYRVPHRTDLNSRALKQVRLLDRESIPVQIVDVDDLAVDGSVGFHAGRRLLRTVNDAAHHLGLPLPSGEVQVFSDGPRGELLLAEAAVRDLAIGEELEIPLGDSPDVQIGQSCGSAAEAGTHCIWITNARPADAEVEIRLHLPDGARILESDHPITLRHDTPGYSLVVRARGSAEIRYRIARAGDRTNAAQ